MKLNFKNLLFTGLLVSTPLVTAACGTNGISTDPEVNKLNIKSIFEKLVNLQPIGISPENYEKIER
jgi:hypothetical protein